MGKLFYPANRFTEEKWAALTPAEQLVELWPGWVTMQPTQLGRQIGLTRGLDSDGDKFEIRSPPFETRQAIDRFEEALLGELGIMKSTNTRVHPTWTLDRQRLGSDVARFHRHHVTIEPADPEQAALHTEWLEDRDDLLGDFLGILEVAQNPSAIASGESIAGFSTGPLDPGQRRIQFVSTEHANGNPKFGNSRAVSTQGRRFGGRADEASEWIQATTANADLRYRGAHWSDRPTLASVEALAATDPELHARLAWLSNPRLMAQVLMSRSDWATHPHPFSPEELELISEFGEELRDEVLDIESTNPGIFTQISWALPGGEERQQTVRREAQARILEAFQRWAQKMEGVLPEHLADWGPPEMLDSNQRATLVTSTGESAGPTEPSYPVPLAKDPDPNDPRRRRLPRIDESGVPEWENRQRQAAIDEMAKLAKAYLGVPVARISPSDRGDDAIDVHLKDEDGPVLLFSRPNRGTWLGTKSDVVVIGRVPFDPSSNVFVGTDGAELGRVDSEGRFRPDREAVVAEADARLEQSERTRSLTPFERLAEFGRFFVGDSPDDSSDAEEDWESRIRMADTLGRFDNPDPSDVAALDAELVRGLLARIRSGSQPEDYDYVAPIIERATASGLTTEERKTMRFLLSQAGKSVRIVAGRGAGRNEYDYKTHPQGGVVHWFPDVVATPPRLGGSPQARTDLYVAPPLSGSDVLMHELFHAREIEMSVVGADVPDLYGLLGNRVVVDMTPFELLRELRTNRSVRSGGLQHAFDTTAITYSGHLNHMLDATGLRGRPPQELFDALELYVDRVIAGEHHLSYVGFGQNVIDPRVPSLPPSNPRWAWPGFNHLEGPEVVRSESEHLIHYTVRAEEGEYSWSVRSRTGRMENRSFAPSSALGPGREFTTSHGLRLSLRR